MRIKLMLKLLFFGVVVAMVGVGMNCKPSEASKLIKRSKKLFGVLPNKMPGSEGDTKELVILGEKLYFDKRLSVNDKQSCNSCHALDNNGFGVDNLPTSPGAKGKNGDRNSPTVLNAGFHIAQFWDGRSPNLKEQAKGPILNPIEMGMPSESAVIKKISKIVEYKEGFKKAYPNDKSPITYDNLANAIAAFERTQITHDRFDDFQNGNEKALSTKEQEGFKAFMDTGCMTCHLGNSVGGRMFQKMGLVNPYKNRKDLGRFKETKNDADRFIFKVPSLRNVAKTAPYFHDGAVADLKTAVQNMAWLQLGKKLDDDTTDSIVAFLGSLTGKKKGSN